MKSFTRCALISLGAFLAFASPLHAMQSVSAGQTCKKAGVVLVQGPKTLVCTKVGKKLIWKLQNGSVTSGGFGSGTKKVGSDIKPGRYLTTTASSSCYWERMSGFGGSLNDIISNDFSGGNHIVVEISATDKGFKSSRCGTWLPYIARSRSVITDGTWVVNDEISPGLWQGSITNGCYWARLSSFSGEFGNLIANELGSALAQIDPTDIGFDSSGCGTWTKVG